MKYNGNKPYKLQTLAMACAMAAPAVMVPQIAIGQTALEEVIVTARKREETLQDIPVTVAALGEEILARGGVDSLLDVGRLIPNMNLYQAGSGSGSGIYLRGVGSSTISAAFDPAVALSVDGVTLSASRMIVAGQLDMRQIEVLKGPQSLYFGKSATAGVVSILSHDPGDELEVMVRAAYEAEHEGTKLEGFISGPITDTFGARLAIATREDDELRENIDPRADSDYRGRESTDMRLTLQWDPTDNFSAKLKAFVSEYEDDGPSWGVNLGCPEGAVQQTTVPAAVFPPGYENCKTDEKMAIPHVGEEWLPDPGYSTASKWNGGTPYAEQDTELYSLQLDWAMSDTLSLTSLTAYMELDNQFFEVFDYTHGNGASEANNIFEMWSQEFRLESSFDGAINFSAGFYYSEIEQQFITGQNAVNSGLFYPDPATGNRYDWDKSHFTDTDSWSVFGALYWDISETLALTAGARYSEDEREGSITIDYMHDFLETNLGFLPGGTVLDEGLEFDDDNLSPEISLSWAVQEDMNLYVSYKAGYKPGGFDNSALPSASLSDGDVSGLIYESETGEGVEAGMKSTLRDGTLRLNATVFYYVYDDLQVQLFDANIIQFTTFNAGELTTQGAEVEFQWATNVDGLLFNGALAYTDAEFTDEFINDQGDDLDGEPVARSAEWAGNVGFTFEREVGANWMFGLSGDARFNDGYKLTDNLNAPEQDSFWLYDASMRFYSADNKYELALIGRNLGDEVINYSTQSRPFACGTDPVTGGCAAFTPPELLDQVLTGGIGRQYTLQFTYRY